MNVLSGSCHVQGVRLTGATRLSIQFRSVVPLVNWLIRRSLLKNIFFLMSDLSVSVNDISVVQSGPTVRSHG